MSGYVTDIEEKTLKNSNFRQVLFTASHSQLVVMSLKPGEEIGSEVHQDNDQFFRIEAGEGKVIIGDREYLVKDDDAIIVPAGVQHNVINTSNNQALKLYTIYSPPHHPDGTIHQTKQEAIAAEAGE